ncbi:MAG TPA: M15 family metallopeptidase [Gemmatimonas sp.]|uniref:M15 family metallopeptidase n=1 Tax=Gemmatimonas sp. TaxID=1962908 RepID=UPI002ED854AE
MSPMDVNWVPTRATPRDLARDAAREASRDIVREHPRDAGRDNTRDVSRPTARPASRGATRANRTDTRTRIEDDSTQESGRERPVSKAEFSALLALLSGMGPSVREGLAEQLPAETASLVDRLLEGETEAVEPDAQTADEALRYGLLQLVADDRSGSNVIDLAAYARSKQKEPSAMTMESAGTNSGREQMEGVQDGTQHAAIQAPARAAGAADASSNDNTSPTDSGAQRARMLDALSRVTSRRGSSVEQLLALGDAKGADARAALDSLLAQAGTPAGARLAARAIMSQTNASLLGGSDNEQALGALSSARQDGVDMTALAAAASHNATATNAVKSGDVATPVKALDGLDPELRARVERVIDRMKNEYGHDVSIVETTRSQERQDWLYEQGRTREGSVVTWTRDSAHTHGEAVDVIIDGRYDNAAGFGRLQRIAKEEGLRTLGMKDPGHLELAQRGNGNSANTVAARTTPTTQIDSASAAGVARVAGVAGVATVASVADASATPRVGMGVNSDNLMQVAQQQAGRGSHNASTNQDGASSERDRGASHSEHRRGDRTSTAIGSLTDNSSAIGATFSNGATVSVVNGTERASASQATTGSDQIQRVADIQQMRADAPATPLNRMTLNVDNGNGTQERITVDLRGNTVSTHISTDANTAGSMRLRTAELQDALGRHGLDGDTVRVSGTRQEPSDAARVTGLERDPLRPMTTASQDGAASSGQRERAPWERQSSRDSQQDSSRREQAEQARDDRQEQQGRQRRPNFFLGNE